MEEEKHPPSIQKLFAPKPPLLYKEPTDYSCEERATKAITPVSSWKTQIDQYKHEFGQGKKTLVPKPDPVAEKNASLQRQLHEWNDPDVFMENEKTVMKDPYRTVFIARLDYKLTEIDISKSFARFGVIDSVRIIRDKTSGASRGYGFVVFESEDEAKSCVSELALAGLKLPDANRTILVDMERGRLVRNWKPRRLGGGLGGRHYTKPNPHHNPNASAAASGRRLFLSTKSQYIPPNSEPVPPTSSYSQKRTASSRTEREDPGLKEKYDKYAKYSSGYKSVTTGPSSRSIRSIRQRE